VAVESIRDFLPLVFESARALADRSRNASTGGTGLGLTIAERLIESQGGTITAAIAAAGGAEFTLTLRRGTTADVEAPAVTQSTA